MFLILGVDDYLKSLNYVQFRVAKKSGKTKNSVKSQEKIRVFVKKCMKLYIKMLLMIKFIINKNCILQMLFSRKICFCISFFSEIFWNKLKLFMILLCIYYVVDNKDKVWGRGLQQLLYLKKSKKLKNCFNFYLSCIHQDCYFFGNWLNLYLLIY